MNPEKNSFFGYQKTIILLKADKTLFRIDKLEFKTSNHTERGWNQWIQSLSGKRTFFSSHGNQMNVHTNLRLLTTKRKVHIFVTDSRSLRRYQKETNKKKTRRLHQSRDPLTN